MTRSHGGESRPGLILSVRAKGQADEFYNVENPTVIPRVGDRVEFGDGPGVVESVTWKPLARPLAMVEVVCVPERP